MAYASREELYLQLAVKRPTGENVELTADELSESLVNHFLHELQLLYNVDEEDYIKMLTHIIRFFRSGNDNIDSPDQNKIHPKSIQACIQHIKSFKTLYDKLASPREKESVRADEIKHIVVKAVGLWVGMYPYFTNTRGYYPIFVGFKGKPANAINEQLANVLNSNRLIPSRSEAMQALDNMATVDIPDTHLNTFLGTLEASIVDCKTLNIYTLTYLTNVKIGWTENLCEHMTLVQNAQKTTLKLFVRPSILLASYPRNLDYELRDEIDFSYSSLFNAYDEKDHARSMWGWFPQHRWCNCPYCSLKRLKNQILAKLKVEKGAKSNKTSGEDPKFAATGPSRMADGEHAVEKAKLAEKPELPRYDPALDYRIEYSGRSDWNSEKYQYLWPRILEMQRFQDESRPWNFWVLFRDRRDVVKFWTFFVALIIIPFTVLQLFLSIAQVAGQFIQLKQSPSP